MKKTFYIIWAIILFIGIGGGSYYYYSKKIKKTEVTKKEEKQLYTCPMHPQIISDKPGSCPICGMNLVPLKKDGAEQTKALEPKKKKIMYRSTMNPNEVSDKPGKDSMGMDMVPFEVEDSEGPSDLSTVYVSQKTADMLGITYETAKVKDLVKEVKTSAIITNDEARLYKVTTKVSGWVEELYVNQTGQLVKKGQPLFKVYSPELLSSQQEYISAIKAEKRLANSSMANMKETLREIRESARERLKLLDINDDQIKRLEETGNVERTVTLYAPATGFVTEKMVVAGQKIMMNEPVLVISDISHVWAEADIYQPDIPFVKVGTPVTLTLSYWPGKVFYGRVTFIYPFLNPETRTLKARMEISNPELILKPQMYADASISYRIGKKVAVPESAVFKTGTKEYVFVKDKEHLKPVIVKTGFRSNDGYYEIISGLKPGDVVVSSANFLIDSESQLKAALRAVTGEHEGHGK